MALFQILTHIWDRKWAFLFTFLGVLFSTYLLLVFLNLDPTFSPKTETARVGANVATYPIETPSRIEIPAVGVASTILNPTNTDPEKLDADLAKGAIRYPNSPSLGERANVLLFGHSSYLPVVRNQAYRAFNEIQNLKKGEEIYVFGTDHVYIYTVDTVEQANALATEIPLVANDFKLTLVTCDTFKQKSDRFIVTATLSRVATLSAEN